MVVSKDSVYFRKYKDKGRAKERNKEQKIMVEEISTNNLDFNDENSEDYIVSLEEDEKNQVNEEFGFSLVILFLFFVGIVVNVGCLITLKRHRSMFHKFLKMMATFDLMVVTCILLMYSLPVMSSDFNMVST